MNNFYPLSHFPQGGKAERFLPLLGEGQEGGLFKTRKGVNKIF
jgi:hypothetical protein